MEINLNWDLSIIVFSLIIISYSFMIGKYQTLKIILSSYIAILASDGIGNLIEQYLINESSRAGFIVIESEAKLLIILKIAIFVILTIVLATKGAFGIVMSQERSRFVSFVVTVSYGILSAGLIISTILVYVSGTSLVEATNIIGTNPVPSMAESSRYVRVMIENYSIWFSLPAIAFIFSSLVGDEVSNGQ